MKKALGAIPKIPRWPKFPKVPDAPNAAHAPDMPDGVSMNPPGGGSGGGEGMRVPGDVHTLPGRIIRSIAAVIDRRSNSGAGSSAHIERKMKEFPLDQYRDADGKVRCPVSQEERNRLKGLFED